LHFKLPCVIHFLFHPVHSPENILPTFSLFEQSFFTIQLSPLHYSLLLITSKNPISNNAENSEE